MNQEETICPRSPQGPMGPIGIRGPIVPQCIQKEPVALGTAPVSAHLVIIKLQ